ncbi:ankyrin repeat-containing protein At5g02620-like [Salvia miltiorrhiza]|uniref:ankyrin repeat-containing protein At5g02620-like n=1 Tax=Salvia miltiorrhiza TaxID=226208 RepID=UPI0025ABBA3F|nr:ankyrin repeat-containing protein At5g02620-like [Salvia miltiorrhiza]
MAAELYDAVSKGDITKFQKLVAQDPYLVESASFACSRNVLHIATMRGQTAMVEEVLNMNPWLSRSLDSQQSSPLHIAAAQGRFEISRKLLSVAPETRWWRDCRDMNPVHIAAVNGHVEILGHLLEESLLPAMERVGRGQTVLHLCVKHGQLTTLQFLVDKLWELVEAVDEDGETLLHLAVRSTQLEILKYLVESKKIRSKPNSMGITPLQILNRSPPGTAHYSEMGRIIDTWFAPVVHYREVLPKMNDAVMVVAVLIATMAFQNAVNPPGGVWQDDASSHKAGDAVIAYTHPAIYKSLLKTNDMAFFSSLLIIFFITSGMTSKSIYALGSAIFCMLVSVTAIALSYKASVEATTPGTKLPVAGRIVAGIGLLLFLQIFYRIAISIFYYVREKRRIRRQELLLILHPYASSIVYDRLLIVHYFQVFYSRVNCP